LDKIIGRPDVIGPELQNKILVLEKRTIKEEIMENKIELNALRTSNLSFPEGVLSEIIFTSFIKVVEYKYFGLIKSDL
tara:strand:+ start:915 stop:1148 length:234 start_codon:yes stop_codon:yes gene_type:complete